jgi:hypothetical protein
MKVASEPGELVLGPGHHPNNRIMFKDSEGKLHEINNVTSGEIERKEEPAFPGDPFMQFMRPGFETVGRLTFTPRYQFSWDPARQDYDMEGEVVSEETVGKELPSGSRGLPSGEA